MIIKQSVKNTMDRIGIDYKRLEKLTHKAKAMNRFSGATCETIPLIAKCISKVYSINNSYEKGDYSIKISDFDRLRYFILKVDSKAYSTCID